MEQLPVRQRRVPSAGSFPLSFSYELGQLSTRNDFPPAACDTVGAESTLWRGCTFRSNADTEGLLSCRKEGELCRTKHCAERARRDIHGGCQSRSDKQAENFQKDQSVVDPALVPLDAHAHAHEHAFSNWQKLNYDQRPHAGFSCGQHEKGSSKKPVLLRMSASTAHQSTFPLVSARILPSTCFLPNMGSPLNACTGLSGYNHFLQLVYRERTVNTCECLV